MMQCGGSFPPQFRRRSAGRDGNLERSLQKQFPLDVLDQRMIWATISTLAMASSSMSPKGMPCSFRNRMRYSRGIRRSCEPGMRYPLSGCRIEPFADGAGGHLTDLSDLTGRGSLRPALRYLTRYLVSTSSAVGPFGRSGTLAPLLARAGTVRCNLHCGTWDQLGGFCGSTPESGDSVSLLHVGGGFRLA